MKETLSPEAITRNLGNRLIGRRVIFYPSVTSTNELAKEEARWGADEGTVVIAGEQTGGKGRLRRSWLSPGGSIALSLVLYPEVAELPSLIMAASLAVARSIAAVTGLEPRLKWPNDVLVGERKVSGILVESQVRGSRVDYAVIGIGINVNFKVADFPEIAPAATSLADELGEKVSLPALIRRLLVEFEGRYLALKAGGGSLYEEWRGSLSTLGQEVRVESGGDVQVGIAQSVDRDGSLLLRNPDGSLSRVVAGEVRLRHQTEQDST
jgi:BirA family biotin operon repressor/biotin-[acetyl-CoA-carboxylase] ligase